MWHTFQKSLGFVVGVRVLSFTLAVTRRAIVLPLELQEVCADERVPLTPKFFWILVKTNLLSPILVILTIYSVPEKLQSKFIPLSN